ncbi:MAG: DUF2019 domain-containing protein [Sphingobium sp.]
MGKSAEVRFVEAAIRHGELRSGADANRAHDKLIKTYHELRATPDQGRAYFSSLLTNPNPSVACWAASFVLWFDEPAARATLTKVADSEERLIGFSAEMTLKEWDAGRLRQPEDWA